MCYTKFGIIAIVFSLLAISLYGQDVIVTIRPYDGTPESFVNQQIVADTLAVGGMFSNRVYEFPRDQYYLHNDIFTVPNGKTLRLRAEEGSGKKPVIYLWETGTGSTPTRPPGYFVVLNSSNIFMKDICLAGYYEPEPDRVYGVQGCFIYTTAAGSSIILDGVVFSNIAGQHVRTGFNSVKVQVTNSIFANMGALTTSVLGAGKGIDLREAACDSLIIVNNTFVNYQDRAIRHYNFADPAAGTGLIDYGRIEHNTFINGMGFHGLFSLGNVGNEIIITNNLFVDAFALGEDSTDATRTAEWANTGELYPNGRNRITWIFTAPNDVTQWTVSNNYYTISDSGWAFLNDFGFGLASPLSWHINSRLGADSANAFIQTDLTLGNIPGLMTNMMRWYEDPNGANKTKSTTNFDKATDDYDRHVIKFYRDSLDATYSTASAAYTGAQEGYPVGDLNWYPELKAKWEERQKTSDVTIHEIQTITEFSNDDSPYLGQTVTTVGVVATDIRSIWIGARWSFILADTNGGDFGFIHIVQHDTTVTGTNLTTVQPGDLIRVTGVVEEYSSGGTLYSSTQLALLTNPPVAIEILESGRPLPTSTLLTNSEFASLETGERHECRRVRIENCTMIDRNLPGYQALIEDATGQFKINPWFNDVRDSLISGEYNYPPNGTSFHITGYIRSTPGVDEFSIGMENTMDLEIITMPPNFTSVTRNPAAPTSSQDVVISAEIIDDGTVVSATIHYSTDNGATYHQAPMSPGTPFTGTIPAQGNGTFVQYYLSAEDNEGLIGYSPYDYQNINYFYTVRDDGLTIYDVQYTPYGDGVSGYNGLEITVSGIVTADINDFPGMYFIQDGSGPWTGLAVLDGINTPSRGDSITVTGRIDEGSAVTTMMDVTTFVNHATTAIPKSILVNTGDLYTGNPSAEQWEDVLVKVANVTVVNPYPDNPGNYGEFTVDDGTGEYRVDDLGNWNGNLNGAFYAGQELDSLIGLQYYTFGNFKLEPRNNNDVFESTTPGLFTKITEGDIVNDGGRSNGCAWGDYNNDGNTDLFVANDQGTNFLYLNEGSGSFSKISTDIIVTDGGNSLSGSWSDFNNDGYLDLFVANGYPDAENNFLYTNNGDGSFTKVTSGDLISDGGRSFACSWGDYDNDGDLDLFVANRSDENNFLYANNGDGTFTRITSGEIVNDGGASFGCGWGDYDNDGDLDLFVANRSGQNNFLYANNGDGTFSKITLGFIVTDGGESNGSSWGDYDNDGDLDLFVANKYEDNFLYMNNGDGSFTKITEGPVVTDGGASFGSGWGDYDNDGDLDLFVANQNENNFLYSNNGDGTFSKITSGIVVFDGGNSSGCCWCDYDNDGDLDLFVANWDYQNNCLYSNNGNSNNWINIKCVGTISNNSAIGAKVRIKATIYGNSVWQLREISAQSGNGNGSQNSLNAEFGLGDATIIDSIKVEWPSGIVQVLTNVAVNQFLSVIEQPPFFTQTIPITHGKLNMISFHIAPPDLAVNILLDDLETLLVAQDDDGSFYIPPYGVNTIGSVDLTNGYQVYITGSADDNVENEGVPLVSHDYSQALTNTKLFMIGYPYQNPHPVTDVFASISSSVVVVQDDEGRFWIPLYGVNTIGTMQPGKGYQIYVNQTVNLTYPALTGGLAKATETVTELPESNHFQFQRTGLPYGIVVTGSEKELAVGDEVGVFAGELCVGAAVFAGDYPLVMAAWEGNEEYGLSGFKVGQTISLRVWKNTEAREVEVAGCFATATESTFRGGPMSVVSLEAFVPLAVIPSAFGLDQNYPNPFNPETVIKYQLPEDSQVSLRIHNLLGQEIRTLVDEQKEAGYHQVKWDGKDPFGREVSSGVYLYTIEAGDFRMTKKMVKME